MKTSDQLLNAVKDAYRFHHLGHEHITSTELGDILMCALCEAMGDGAFCEWLESFDDPDDDLSLTEYRARHGKGRPRKRLSIHNTQPAQP